MFEVSVVLGVIAAIFGYSLLMSRLEDNRKASAKAAADQKAATAKDELPKAIEIVKEAAAKAKAARLKATEADEAATKAAQQAKLIENAAKDARQRAELAEDVELEAFQKAETLRLTARLKDEDVTEYATLRDERDFTERLKRYNQVRAQCCVLVFAVIVIIAVFAWCRRNRW